MDYTPAIRHRQHPDLCADCHAVLQRRWRPIMGNRAEQVWVCPNAKCPAKPPLPPKLPQVPRLRPLTAKDYDLSVEALKKGRR